MGQIAWMKARMPSRAISSGRGCRESSVSKGPGEGRTITGRNGQFKNIHNIDQSCKIPQGIPRPPLPDPPTLQIG